MQKTEPRIGIMSRTHNVDLPSAIIENGIVIIPSRVNDNDITEHIVQKLRVEPHCLIVEVNPRYMMSGLHSRAKEAWIEPHGDWSPKRLSAEGFSTKDIENFYERAIITQHVPWLDGARECLMTLAHWLEGL